MKSETRKARVEDVMDRMRNAFQDLVACKHDLEECGVSVQVKKLDTITGKLENVTHELSWAYRNQSDNAFATVEGVKIVEFTVDEGGVVTMRDC